jgi:hypothetical protein
MRGKTLFACVLLTVATVLTTLQPAQAHGLIGKRFLPATLAIDDPFVADELSLPTVSSIKMPGSGDGNRTWETDVSAEFSKRLTPDLGFSLLGTWKNLDPDQGPSMQGFDNLEVTLKYQFFKSPEHETLVSAGVAWEVGGTGSKKVGSDSFDRVTPTLFFGKGFGDMPDSLEWFKPIAVTGVFGYSFPTRVRNQTISIADDGSVDIARDLNPEFVRWGFSLQYSLQYLQSFVRDVGLPAPLNRMIPIVEFAMQTPTNGPQAGHTTGTINPGIIWFGRYVQLGIEAQFPVSAATGKNVGVLAQMHFYLDDILPQVFTWTPFHGVLGPTQPK